MSLKVESDADLAFQVGPPAQALPLHGVAGKGSLAHPYSLPVTPWEFLLAAGRATAAIFSPSKALFEVSAHWAVARWFWAFDWSNEEVRLSRESRHIRNHHRTAFSEATGLASALLIAEHIAGDALPPGIWWGGPMLVDVDSLISSGKRPDLLILFGGPHGEAYVLEAKGNSVSRDVSINQLGRGMDQVLAISGPAKRLVIGAACPGPSVSAYAVSVSTPPTKTVGLLLRKAEERVLEMELERLGSFAGLGHDQAAPVFPMPELGLEVVGRRRTIEGESFNAEITTGVDREIIHHLKEVRSPAELSELRLRASGDGHRRTPKGEPGYSLTETGHAAAVALDGCAISLSLL